MTIILLLAPGILAAAYFCHLRKTSLKSLDFPVYSVLFIFLINLFGLCLFYLAGHKDVPTDEMFKILGNAARFGGVALIAAFAFPNIIILFEKLLKGKTE